MRSVLTATAIVASVGLVGAGLAAARAAGQPGPSRSTALAYAKRTYVVVPRFGKVPFQLGKERSVTAKDGSTITAFSITSDPGGTADSFQSTVMFFRGGTFLGWASSRDEMFLTLEPSTGNAIHVLYPVWNKGDATCCPSAHEVISYSWNGSRIAASAQPPLIYGRQGSLLHLASG